MSRISFILPLVMLLALMGTLFYSYDQTYLSETNLRWKKVEHKTKENVTLLEEFMKETHDHEHREFVCDHDEFMKNHEMIQFDLEPSPIEATLNHEKDLRSQHKAGNWSPIRVLADYSNIKVNADLANIIQTKLVPAVILKISKAYSVYPKTSISEVIGQKTCLGVPIPTNYQTSGIDGQDLVIFFDVTFDRSIHISLFVDAGYAARAGTCIQDKQTGRPVAAMVQFNNAIFSDVFQFVKVQIDTKNPNDLNWMRYIDVTIHEVTHALGFSSRMFSQFIDPSTNKLLGLDKVVLTTQGRDWIILPNVLALTRSHFNCPTAIGAALENQGGPGTAGSHWERIVFGDEVLSPTSGPIFSAFTLKVMEGSGWYLPDYSVANQFTWGKNEGCAIPSASQWPTNTVEYCNTPPRTRSCYSDGFALASCQRDDYFASNNPYFVKSSNFDCRRTGTYLDYISENTGGGTGPDSRCFDTTVSTQQGLPFPVSCLKSQCTPDKTQIKFKVGIMNYLCTQSAQVINVEYKVIFGGRYYGSVNGTVTCPTIELFCRFENACISDCSGKGSCKASVCTCQAGYTGVDCSQMT